MATMNSCVDIYAVVTGSNKGIGFEICRQLASKGVMVVLTARDVKRGQNALQQLKKLLEKHSGNVIFHQLDVTDPSSITNLAEFIKNQFGRLDILVNNAAMIGAFQDENFSKEVGNWTPNKNQLYWEAMTQTYEFAEECLKTNYYGAKTMIEAFTPLLQLSESPKIVNVSSLLGRLLFLKNEWAINVLSDVETLTEERIDEVLNEFLKDFKEGLLQAKGWPPCLSANTMSKIAMNAHTRILARRHPSFRINCVCPGHVKTDLSFHTGLLTPEEGAQVPVKLALLSREGPSGLYYMGGQESSF